MNKKHPLLLRYLKIRAREKNEIFRFRSTLPLMLDPNKDYEIQTRKALSEQCTKLHRRLPIRGEVAVELRVFAAFHNIDTLGKFIKKHIDLLYPPKLQGTPIEDSKLTTVLQDDSQIEYISARHFNTTHGSSAWILRVIPIGLISEWCKLIRDSANEFDDDIFDAPILDDQHNDLMQTCFKESLTFDNSQNKEFSAENRTMAQFGLLRRSALNFHFWSALFEYKRRFKGHRFEEGWGETLKKMRDSILFAEENIRKSSEVVIKLKSVNGFIEVPSPKRRRKNFMDDLRNQIAASPFKNSKLGEWKQPISVSCFYRPPRLKNSFDHDVDNIAQYVIRQVESILKPPSSSLRGAAGIHHFECKRLKRGDGFDSGEVGFLFQEPFFSHFLEILDSMKKITVNKLRRLKDWRDYYL